MEGNLLEVASPKWWLESPNPFLGADVKFSLLIDVYPRNSVQMNKHVEEIMFFKKNNIAKGSNPDTFSCSCNRCFSGKKIAAFFFSETCGGV